LFRKTYEINNSIFFFHFIPNFILWKKYKQIKEKRKIKHRKKYKLGKPFPHLWKNDGPFAKKRFLRILMSLQFLIIKVTFFLQQLIFKGEQKLETALAVPNLKTRIKLHIWLWCVSRNFFIKNCEILVFDVCYLNLKIYTKKTLVLPSKIVFVKW